MVTEVTDQFHVAAPHVARVARAGSKVPRTVRTVKITAGGVLAVIRVLLQTSISFKVLSAGGTLNALAGQADVDELPVALQVEVGFEI